VLIVDDVITAGTAIREVMDLLQRTGATPAGILVALDRQERGTGSLSAIQEIRQQYGIPVICIISLEMIVSYLGRQQDTALAQSLAAVEAYREQYGV
jgi:orotate phosphoribosyltransferase